MILAVLPRNVSLEVIIWWTIYTLNYGCGKRARQAIKRGNLVTDLPAKFIGY